MELQPLVENSIQHGFIVKEDKNDCFIELYGWREDDDITLLIKDNGAGIPPEQLEHILSSNESSYTHAMESKISMNEYSCIAEWAMAFSTKAGFWKAPV